MTTTPLRSPSRLSRAVRDDDLESVAIAIAADENPAMQDVRGRLDDLARILAPRVLAEPRSRRLAPLVRGVYRTLGFETPESYDDPRLQLIDAVLDRREGSPVALSVVLIALGRRLGTPLEAVAFPGHFMVRFAAPAPVYIDPSSGAFPFPEACLLELAADELRVSKARARRLLAPVGARAVAIRLLRNLQSAHETRGELGRAMLVTDRLYEVTGSAEARCERGLRAAALGAPHGALDDLEAYLGERHDRTVQRAARRLSPSHLDLN